MTTYLTTTEAATVLRKTAWFVRRLCQSGELRASRFGGEWHITEDALAAYVEEHTNAPTQTPTRRRPRRDVRRAS